MFGLIYIFFKANLKFGWRWRSKHHLKNLLDHEEINDLLQQIMDQANPQPRTFFQTPWLMIKRGLLM